MAGKLSQGIGAAGRWLVPSVFAAGCGTWIGGAVEARAAVIAGHELEAAATVGFLALLGIPLLVVTGALLRGLWAAWAPRELARRIVDERGAAPKLAAWLFVLACDAIAIAWATFQGVWALANHTAFKAISVGFIEPVIILGAALLLVVVSVPATRAVAYLLGRVEARWQRVHGDRPLLTPWRILWVTIAILVTVGEAVWRFGIKPKIGPFDTAVFDAPLFGLTAWGVALAVAVRLPRRALGLATAIAAGAGVVAITAALYAWKLEPGMTLEIWGDRPAAGFAIDMLFDLDDIRAGMSLAEFQPVAKPDSPHPDIILVTIDTVRADHTPPYDPSGAEMPVLRQLAHVGVVFDWAFSPSNVTRRSIPSMVIGMAPDRVRGRVVGWALRVDPRHVLVAERLAAGGYDTAGFMCCEGFWGKEFHTGLQRGLEHLEIVPNGPELAKRAREWLEERDRTHPQKPLFLWMHILEPHNWTVASGEGRNDSERRRFYDRSLSQSDAMLGEVLNAFSHRDPGKAPIVIVTADHGEALGEHGHPYHSTDLYDSQTHVPLVIAGPGIPQHRVDETVSLIDLVPTILELAGFEVPTGQGLDGISIADLATGKRVGDPEAGTAYAAMIQDRSNPGGIRMIVRGRWKLIENEGGSYELYDTRDDPDELHNVWLQNGKTAFELKHLLDDRRRAAETSPFE
nr:sulfatase [Kofleriaceae bacterium]